MNRFDFSGKTFLVTGASSGIGRQTAMMLSEANAKLLITGRTPEKLEEVYSLLKGSGHMKFAADLSGEQQINELMGRLPEVNGMVHCAGVSPLTPIRYVKSSQIREVFAINYEAALFIVSKALAQKKIIKNASLVFVSSQVTTTPLFGGSLYCSSKLALEGLSKTLAIELSPKNIRSNCVCPAYVFSPMVDQAGQAMSTEFIEKFRTMHPNGFGYPVDVASVILSLLSDETKWLNGQNIHLGAFNINIPSL